MTDSDRLMRLGSEPRTGMMRRVRGVDMVEVRDKRRIELDEGDVEGSGGVERLISRDGVLF